MQLTVDKPNALYTISSYEKGSITIADKQYDNSVIVAADNIISPWTVADVNSLNIGHFQPIFELQPEIILLGSGENIQFPEAAIVAEIVAKKVGFETMDTIAACRTYNLLIAEGRQVVAALML